MFSFAESHEHINSDDKFVLLQGGVEDSEVREAKLLLATFIESNAHQYKSIRIDVSGIEHVSSVIVAILLSGLRSAKKHSCDLRYVNLSEYLFNIARVGGVESILVGKS